MGSWHDYQLIGYTVDGENKQIIFQMLWASETKTDISRVNVAFSGVEGYHFERDMGENIVSDIKVVPLKPFLVKNARFFKQQRQWGWPLFWQGSVAATLAYLESKHVQCWELSASFGLSGWLLAQGEPNIRFI